MKKKAALIVSEQQLPIFTRKLDSLGYAWTKSTGPQGFTLLAVTVDSSELHTAFKQLVKDMIAEAHRVKGLAGIVTQRVH